MRHELVDQSLLAGRLSCTTSHQAPEQNNSCRCDRFLLFGLPTSTAYSISQQVSLPSIAGSIALSLPTLSLPRTLLLQESSHCYTSTQNTSCKNGSFCNQRSGGSCGRRCACRCSSSVLCTVLRSVGCDDSSECSIEGCDFGLDARKSAGRCRGDHSVDRSAERSDLARHVSIS